MEFEFDVQEDKEKILHFDMRGMHLQQEIGHKDTFDLEDLHKAVIKMKERLDTIFNEYSSKEKMKLREYYHERLTKKYKDAHA